MSFTKPETDDRSHPDEEKIRTMLGLMYTMGFETKVHAKMCQEMVAFLNYCFGNDAWYTLWRLKHHRESNHERRGKVSEEPRPAIKKKGWHPKGYQADSDLNLNWLQLTEENRDMAVVGPDPLWLKFVREENDRRKNLKEMSTAIDSSKMADTYRDAVDKLTIDGATSRAKASQDIDVGDSVVIEEDEEQKAEDVLSRASGDNEKMKIQTAEEKDEDAKEKARLEADRRALEEEARLLEQQKAEEEKR